MWKRIGGLQKGLDMMATVSIIAVSALLAWTLLQPAQPAARARARPEPPIPSEPVSLSGATLKGDPKAPVALLVFSDFQCPFCGQFARDTMPEIERLYVNTKKVLLAFRNNPLVSIHPVATQAARTSLCAGVQGKFWEMHDRIFESPGKLSEASLREHATALKLDGRKLDACLKSAEVSRIDNDLAEGKRLSVVGTPSFFLGKLDSEGLVHVTDRLGGAKPLEDFKAVLDRLLAAPSGG